MASILLAMSEEWRIESDPPTQFGKERVASLATKQHGRIGRWQLKRLCVGNATIVAWVRTGYLFRSRLRGVYAVGHAAPSTEATLSEALLYAGEDAMLSHESAIWWYGLLDRQPRTIQISTPGRRRSRPGIRIHQRRKLDRVWHKGLPVTTVAQAVLDYAATAAPNRLEYVISQVEYHGLTDLEELKAKAGSGKRGSTNLDHALTGFLPQLALTKSRLERKFLPLVPAAGLSLPEVNVHIEGIEVDAVWRDRKLIVELDGGRAHSGRYRVAKDRRKELVLRRAGYLVIRYSEDQLDHEPDAVVQDLVAAYIRVSYASPTRS